MGSGAIGLCCLTPKGGKVLREGQLVPTYHVHQQWGSQSTVSSTLRSGVEPWRLNDIPVF